MTTKVEIPQARALTRKELRQMKEAGLDPVYMDPEQLKKEVVLSLNQRMADFIVDKFYPGVDWDDIDNSVILELADKTYQLSYNRKEKQDEEVKN